MSYILEALKKAESERKLGSVPNIHAQPLAAASAGRTPLLRNPFLWSALVALLLIGAAIAWFAPWQAEAPTADVASAASLPEQTSSGSINTQAKPERPLAAAPQVPAPQADVPAASPPVVRETPVAQSAPPPAPTQDTAPVEPAKPKPAPKPAAKKKSEPEKAPVASEPAERKTELAAAAPAPTKAQEAYVPSARELPENIQREIPALTVGGYIYSSVPAERSVLINNRLLREGSEIAPGLMLEKMLPKEAVLNYRGYRYRIPY